MEKHLPSLTLIISYDLKLPLSGPELAKKARKLGYKNPFIMVTKYKDEYECVDKIFRKSDYNALLDYVLKILSN